LLKKKPSELEVKPLKMVRLPNLPIAVLVNVDPETFVASVISTSTTIASASAAEAGDETKESRKATRKILAKNLYN
jgi:hypothetical protein